MIFSILALALFMAVFVVANVVSDTAHDLALSITLHADAAAGIPDVDRNGNKWSDEQLRVLRAFAKAIWDHKNGGKPISIAVSAVAGSGKTSLLQGMTHIVAKLAPELLTAMTAFNTHIAASSKDILIQFKSTDGLNIKIFGGRNTVNAGGRGMLLTKAKAEGFSDIDFPSYGNDRYARLARLTLAGWLARADRLPLLENAKVAMEVKTTSHAFNNMIGDGLVKAANIAMDEGYVPKATVRSNVPSPYVPPSVVDSDVNALAAVIHRVGVNQSWDENPARNLGDRAVFELVVEILAVAIETAFMKVDLKPFCGEGKSFMDAYVPFKKADRRGGFETWQPIAPVRKQIFTTDPDIIKKAQFAILENGGCRFPPASKDGKGSKAGVKAISFDTEAKAIVKHHDGVVVMSFENGGHAKRLGGKGIGTQFGFNGDYTVNGERISKWRQYVKSKGYTMVHPEHLGKVIALLTEVFGDEFHNMLDEGTYEDVQHEVVEAGKGTLVLSMADMIYLPHALDLQVPIHERADVVFIDEVQDLSVLKANLVWRLAKEDAHKVIVGDLRQAIYLFAGASAQSFEDNAKNINAEFFPQTICWRGTEMVAASARLACRRFTSVARRYWPNLTTPDYDAHRSPLEAGYDWWPMGAMPVQITANELIKAYHKSRQLHGEDTTFGLLCRVKKPLAGFILHLIKNGIPVSTPATVGDSKGLVDEAFNIANKDRMKFLDKSFQKVGGRAIVGLGWKAMPASKISQHSLLLRDLENVKKAIVSKYTDMFKGDTKSMAQSAEFQELMGNVELLEAFVSLHRTKGGKDEVKGKNLSSALQTWVEEALFTERGGAAVHIATIHRYKGDEADVMFIVNEMMVEDDEGEKPMSCFMSQRSCEASPESATNEISMGYVAFTRAKKQNIIINVDLQGEVCSDVEQRLQAAFDRDVEALTTSTVQEPQDTPESDSGATDEATADLDRCVECSTIIAEDEEYGTCSKCGGHLCRERMPDHHTNAGDVSDLASCGSYVGNISLDEMMNGDEATLESKRTCTACSDDEDSGGKEATDEQQPTLPKVLPSPVVIMKRDWSKKSKGERNGQLVQKMHIDANPDEPTGESLCGKRFSIHPTLNTPKGEYMAGKFTGGSRTPEPTHASTEIGIARRYYVHYGYGYNAGSRTCYTVLTDEEDHYCQRCVAKWKKQHGMGVFSPVDSLAAVQHGLLHQLPMEFSFRDGEKPYGSIKALYPIINKDGTRETSNGRRNITLAHFATKEENVLIKPERWGYYNAHGDNWGDVERLENTSFRFEVEVQEMIDAGRMAYTERGSLKIPFADELLKDVDCTDLEGEVADFVAEFLNRYMVARCFEPETQTRIQEDWPHATVWDKMFNRMKNVKDEIKSKDMATTQWKKDFDPSLPHTLKEWEALPMKEDA